MDDLRMRFLHLFLALLASVVDSVWDKHEKHNECYWYKYMDNVERVWDNARTFCESYSATLPLFINPVSQEIFWDFVTKNSTRLDQYFAIGLKLWPGIGDQDVHKPTSWFWDHPYIYEGYKHGWSRDYKEAMPIANAKYKYASIITGDTNGWINVEDTKKLFLICQRYCLGYEPKPSTSTVITTTSITTTTTITQTPTDTTNKIDVVAIVLVSVAVIIVIIIVAVIMEKARRHHKKHHKNHHHNMSKTKSKSVTVEAQ